MFDKENMYVRIGTDELPKFYTFFLLDTAYTGFSNKLVKVVNAIITSKESRIKNNTDKWFNSEYA